MQDTNMSATNEVVNVSALMYLWPGVTGVKLQARHLSKRNREVRRNQERAHVATTSDAEKIDMHTTSKA